MLPNARALLLSVAAAVTALAGVDVIYGRYAQNHFGPNVTLKQA